MECGLLRPRRRERAEATSSEPPTATSSGRPRCAGGRSSTPRAASARAIPRTPRTGRDSPSASTDGWPWLGRVAAGSSACRALTEADADPAGRLRAAALVFTVEARQQAEPLRRRTSTGLLSVGSRPRAEALPPGRSGAHRLRREGCRLDRLNAAGKRVRVGRGSAPDWSPSGRSIALFLQEAHLRDRRPAGRSQAARRAARHEPRVLAQRPPHRLPAGRRDHELRIHHGRAGREARRLATGGELPIGSSFVSFGALAWRPPPGGGALRRAPSPRRAARPEQAGMRDLEVVAEGPVDEALRLHPARSPRASSRGGTRGTRRCAAQHPAELPLVRGAERVVARERLLLRAPALDDRAQLASAREPEVERGADALGGEGRQCPAESPTKKTPSSVASRSLWGIQLPW